MRTNLISLVIFLLTANIDATHSLSTRLELPTLNNVVSQLSGTQLSFQVAVGSEDSPFQMQGPSILLSDKTNNGNDDDDGPSNKNGYSRTCLFESLTQEDPYYINIEGKQVVELQNPAWQVAWNRDSPFGFLICSFHAPDSLQRTAEGGVLEEGQFFLYHRMWSAPTLHYERLRRKAIQAQAGKHLADRDALVQQLQEPNDDNNNNAWTKLKTYGQAYKAANKFRDSGMRGAKFTPLYDNQVLEVSSDCILSTRGRVFRKADWQRDFMVREEDLMYMGEEESREMAYIGECRVDFSQRRLGTKESNA